MSFDVNSAKRQCIKTLKRLPKMRLFLPLVCLFLVLIINIIRTPNFFEIRIQNGVLYGYIIDVINRASELVILAVGMTLVVAASGGTDISVGAVMAVAASLCCAILTGGELQLVGEYANPLILGILGGLVIAAACGAWNGFLVAHMNIQPMVATLILYTAGRGLAQLIVRGQIYYVRVDSFRMLGAFIPGCPVPTSCILSTIVVVLVALACNKTALGLYVKSVGINKDASRLVGIKAKQIIFLCYAFCGLLAGVAGMIATSRIYSADANNIGLNLEMDAILSVALGGNSLAGGNFSLAGSVIGAYTIQALTTTLYAMGVKANQIPVYKAIIVIIIVALQSPEFKRYMGKITSKRHSAKVQVAAKGAKA